MRVKLISLILVAKGLAESILGEAELQDRLKEVLDLFPSLNATLLDARRAKVPAEFYEVERPIVSRVGTPEDAYHYATFNSITYCGGYSLHTWRCHACSGDVQLVFVANDIYHSGRVLLLRDNTRKEIVLAIRGSRHLRNWIENMVYEFAPLPRVEGVRVHKGFKDSSDVLTANYIKTLSTTLKNHADYRFVITGHSLGGAVAILAALELKHRLQIPWEKIEVFTYGQPRTGDVAFARYVNSLPMHVTRVVNDNDIVPHILPEYGHFAHHGTEIYVQGKNFTVCSTRTLEDPACSKSRFPDVSIQSHNHVADLNIGSLSC